MANDIKQRSIIKDIKMIDRTVKLSPKGQKQINKMKDEVSSISDSDRRENTPSGYADKEISGASKEAVYAVQSSIKRVHGIKAKKATADNAQIKTKEYTRRFFERSLRSKSISENPTISKTKLSEIKSKAVQIKAKQCIGKKASHTATIASEKAGRNKAIKEMATNKMAKNAAKKTAIRNAKKAKEALLRMVKLIAASMKSLIAVLGAGGALVVFIMIFIILIGAIVSSPMGIFFSNDNGNTMTMKSVVEQLNTEFASEVKKVEDANPHDEIQTVSAGPYIDWKEVIAIYACKITEDKDNPLDVVVIDEARVSLLRAIMLDMNKISSEMKTEAREKTVPSTDAEGNEIQTTETVTVSILVVTITHKTASEMADEYLFTGSQRKSLEELLDKSNDELWAELLGGIASGGGFGEPSKDRIPTGMFTWPLEIPGVITSYFGNRADPFTGAVSYHSGTDIAAPSGTPILAPADGTVIIANSTDSWGGGWGYYVKLNHSNGVETLYGHCSALAVNSGEMVRKGQVIAYIGSSGRSTGPHLHWEVYLNGVRSDALAYFK